MSNLSVGITDKNHFLEHSTIIRILWDNFPEDKEQLLDGVILNRHDKSDDNH